jgi:hypothetical protein
MGSSLLPAKMSWYDARDARAHYQQRKRRRRFAEQVTLNHELAREFVGGYRISYQFRTMLGENESSVGRAVD